MTGLVAADTARDPVAIGGGAVASTCCKSGADALMLVGDAKKLKEGFVLHDPGTTEPWKGLLRMNTPGRVPAGAPLFIAQGTKDNIVHPQVTAEFVKQARARGENLDFVWLKVPKSSPVSKGGCTVCGGVDRDAIQTNRTH